MQNYPKKHLKACNFCILQFQNLYEATCQLREKRLDIEEALTEEKKVNETWKKEVDGLNKKSKIIGSALTTAQQDLEAFQVGTVNLEIPEKSSLDYRSILLITQSRSCSRAFNRYTIDVLQYNLKLGQANR